MMCVTDYRHTSELMLIEWIELHVLLGASEIIIYKIYASEFVSMVLESYVKDTGQDGVRLTVIPWHFPSNRITDHFNQHEAMNDCIYRAALRHRYVVVSDLDEVLVHRKPGGWPKFIADEGRDSGVGAFLFQHAYFRCNYTSPASGRRERSPYLVTLQSLWRTDVVKPPGKICCKVYDSRIPRRHHTL